jgi:predicted amidohydrolase
MVPFRVAAAQVPSQRGNVERNVATHLSAIEAAARHGVSLLVFPELSLTGYEPSMAAEFAIAPNDPRLAPLAESARRHRMEIVVGAPLGSAPGTQLSAAERPPKPALGAIVFGHCDEPRIYRKMHLGGDEPEYFEPGDSPLVVTVDRWSVGLAICADSSSADHPRTYAERECGIYAAGVFLTAEWFASDTPRLASHAARHRMLVVMANHGASTGTYASVGRSAVWNPSGVILASARGDETALVIATWEESTWSGAVALA